jgi:hypothetical protein
MCIENKCKYMENKTLIIENHAGFYVHRVRYCASSSTLFTLHFRLYTVL